MCFFREIFQISILIFFIELHRFNGLNNFIFQRLCKRKPPVGSSGEKESPSPGFRLPHLKLVASAQPATDEWFVNNPLIADWLTQRAQMICTAHYGFKLQLFSVRSHSICLPNELFYWPCYLFMDIFTCWTGFSFSLSTEFRRSLGAWTRIVCLEGKSSDRVLL